MSWIAFLDLPQAREYPEQNKVLLKHCNRFSPCVEPVDAGQVFLDLGGGAVPPLALAQDLASRLISACNAVPGPAPARDVVPRPTPACGSRLTLAMALARSKLVAQAMAAAFASGLLSQLSPLSSLLPLSPLSPPPPEQPAVQVHRESYGDILAVPLGQEARCLVPLPVDCLWPLAPQLRTRLRLLGFDTIGLLAGIPAADLRRQFPAEAALISLYCQGADHHPVRPLYPPGRLSYSATVEELADRMALRPFLALAAADLGCGGW